jgi:transposase
MELWQLLEEYEQIEKQLNDADIMIGIVTADIPEVNELMKIPGIGMITAAGMISEIGDIRRFDDPREIQKLAGLAIVVNESGKHKGQSEISRRGRKRLRKILFQAAMSLVKSNKEFKTVHDYFTTREKNPLKKMQSLMAVAAKLLRVCFGMVKNSTPYDPTKVLKDIRKMEPKAA